MEKVLPTKLRLKIRFRTSIPVSHLHSSLLGKFQRKKGSALLFLIKKSMKKCGYISSLETQRGIINGWVSIQVTKREYKDHIAIANVHGKC